MKVKFQPIYRNFRYEVAKTETDKYYLVDMGVPFISWFILTYSYMFSRRCYPISSKTAKLLLDQKKTGSTSGYLGIGLGVSLTLLVRQTNNFLSISWDFASKVVLVSIITLGIILLRAYYMLRAAADVRAAGAVIEAEERQLIHFKPVEIKVVALMFGSSLLISGIVIGFAFMIFQPTVNLIAVGLFALMVFIHVVLSSMTLIPERWFEICKHRF